MSSDSSLNKAYGRRGLMLVLSSPSGAGKTTLSKKLVELDSNLIMSTSYTTRTKRVGEKDGQDYHFVEVGDFKEMIGENQLLEYALIQLNKELDPCLGFQWKNIWQKEKMLCLT